jgi:hypothetical protein
MGYRTAFVDDQLVARDFNTGDVVRKPGLNGRFMSPYVGRVLYSNTATGVVSVQWPWGQEQERASELIRDTSEDFIPSSCDQSYSSWEGSRNINDPAVTKADEKWRNSLASRVVKQFELQTMPVYRAACKAAHYGLDEIEAYERISYALSDIYGDDTVRRTVANLYETGRRFAIYWKDSKRRYRVTQKEKTSGILYCPRCRGILKPRVYRAGQRVMLCGSCGFSIHPRDLRL